MDPSSTADEVAAPVTLVELRDLKTVSGAPFRVYVERVPEEQLVDIMRLLPGATPKPPEQQAAPDDAAARDEVAVRKWLGWAPQLIPTASFLVLADGREVRPAFYFDGEPTTHSVPGKYLTARDRSLLMNAILSLSGWSKEATASAQFHDGDGRGSGARAGHMDVRESMGPDAVGRGA